MLVSVLAALAVYPVFQVVQHPTTVRSATVVTACGLILGVLIAARLGLSFRQWAPLLVASLVASVAVILVIGWQEKADRSRYEQVIFSRLAVAVSNQTSAEDRAISIGNVTPELLDDVRAQRR